MDFYFCLSFAHLIHKPVLPLTVLSFLLSSPQKNTTTNKKITFWFATGGAGFCLSRALTLKMLPIAGGGKFISIGDKIRFPDDVTMGFIIGEWGCQRREDLSPCWRCILTLFLSLLLSPPPCRASAEGATNCCGQLSFAFGTHGVHTLGYVPGSGIL